MLLHLIEGFCHAGYGSCSITQYFSQHSIQSSNIDAVDHDGKTLTVHFKSGAKWSYHAVPEPVFRKMLSADSIARQRADRVGIFSQWPRPTSGDDLLGMEMA